MTERNLLEWFEIEDADYDFNFYDKKEIVSKMLDNQQPKHVKNFDSTSTEWDLWGDIDDYFYLCIEGARIETNSCIGNFIEDFLFFLMQLAYTDDKTLICPFDDEGSAYIFTTIPVDNNCIRVSVFHSSKVDEYNPESKFFADIVIEKDTFLKQMRDILQIAADIDKKPRNPYSAWLNKIKYTIKELDKYFDNPNEFKANYESKRHIRVFDIAYKTIKNRWKFEVCLEDDEKANIMYWRKLKAEGKILDYDFFEQFSESLFAWNKKHNGLIRLTVNNIRKKLKNHMSERVERNWVYSKDTKQWYSENEIMPIPKKNIQTIKGNLNYDIVIGAELYAKSEEKILESYINSNSDMICSLKLKSDNKTVCEIKFSFKKNEHIRNALKKANDGEYVRFSLCDYNQDKIHLWQQFYLNTETKDAEYLTIACYDYFHKELYALTVDKKWFIDCFTNALDEIEHKIDVAKKYQEKQ